MADRSKIEWTDASWNPIRARRRSDGRIGWFCEKKSAGCANCYAEGFDARLGTGFAYKPGHRDDVEVFLDETMLLAPLRWTRPRRIFVCSMTDLFGAWMPDAMIDRVFAVMALCPRHTFQVLTKRPERMRRWFAQERPRGAMAECIATLCVEHPIVLRTHPFDKSRAVSVAERGWPLPNVWLGTSCEDQATADERVPELLATPAAIRFVSAEPLLGPIDLTAIDVDGWHEVLPLGAAWLGRDGADELGQPKLDWIILGGESGPHARPMHPRWARDIRDQCVAAAVAFFFKQWGEFVSVSEQAGPGRHHKFADGATVRRIGKKAATRTLDGVEWNDMPCGLKVSPEPARA